MSEQDSLEKVGSIQRKETDPQPQKDAKRPTPWWLYVGGALGIMLICGGVVVALVLGGVLPSISSLVTAEEPTASALPEPSPQPTNPPRSTPTGAPTASPQPTATLTEGEATAEAEQTPSAETTPTAEASVEPPADAPIEGTFDVYIGPPVEGSGEQQLRWDNVETSETITTLTVNAREGSVVRAGDYVYWVDADSGDPQRANTAGATQTLDFAAPPAGAAQYDFLPSALGEFLAWMTVTEGGQYAIAIANVDGTNIRTAAEGDLAEGITAQLVRVTDDGSQIFFDQRPDNVIDSLFGGYYDLYVANVGSAEVTQLPGEPACGEFIACGGSISRDGAFLVRTIPAALSLNPVIVTNLVSGQVIARFSASSVPEGAQFTFGDPIFSPGGELVYMAAYGPTDFERYRIVFADLVTEEQRVVTDLAAERHEPLGWAGNGLLLLTTRPGLYDTWQFNITDGRSRQIASLLFIGTITVEPQATP